MKQNIGNSSSVPDLRRSMMYEVRPQITLHTVLDIRPLPSLTRGVIRPRLFQETTSDDELVNEQDEGQIELSSDVEVVDNARFTLHTLHNPHAM